jgi:hypothetical protein
LGTLVSADYVYVEPKNETVLAGSLFQTPGGAVLPGASHQTGFNQGAGGYQTHSKRLRRRIRNLFFGLVGLLGALGAFLLYWNFEWALFGYGLMLVSLLMAAWGAIRLSRLPGIALIIALLAGGAVLTRMHLKNTSPPAAGGIGR